MNAQALKAARIALGLGLLFSWMAGWQHALTIGGAMILAVSLVQCGQLIRYASAPEARGIAAIGLVAALPGLALSAGIIAIGLGWL